MNETAQSRSGGCLCGAVRFTVTAKPLGVRTCWCRDCQYLGAGSATVNVIFPADAVAITGETKDFSSRADSGNIMHRRFCPRCGTALFSASEARPHLIIIRAGAMDDASDLKPGLTIWTNSAPSWACLDPTIPTSDRQPPPVS